MGNGFSPQTLKVKTKIGAQRIQQHIGKKQNALVKQRREIATLIANDKEQSARIRVEGIIREENLCQVYEWLQMMMELLNQRIKQIQTSSSCPDDLAETVCTLLYCSRRVDIPEIEEVCQQLGAKWGRKWIDANVENRSGRVSRQIIDKLSPQPPTRETVIGKLREIAERHDIDYEPGADASGMPAIVGHRDEYTVEFAAKPFGMEWTATEDNMNLWVSRVHDGSQAANAGIVPGSMLIAFNGVPVVGLGAPKIHEQAAALGLPLRVSFRKPSGSTGGAGDQSVREDVVHRCVNLLKDPSRWDLSDDQKKELCAANGANGAETMAAVFLAEQMIEQMNQAPVAVAPVSGPAYGAWGGYNPAQPANGPAFGGMGQPPMGQPPIGQPPLGSTGYEAMGEPVGSPPIGGPMGGQPIGSQFDGAVAAGDSGLDLPEPPRKGGDPNDGGMDDLEARFARLRDGL